jgi:hypothetical protein
MIKVMAAMCLLLLACNDHKLERDFFSKHPLGTRLERIKHYSLPDQYKIYRYAHDKLEPPLLDMADPIAEKGATTIPFLTEQLKTDKDDLAVRDIVYLVEKMRRMKTFDARTDPALIQLLKSRILSMKPSRVQYSSREAFEYLTDSSPEP